jgi:hypothetical protein
MPIRTINHPGVELREFDRSQYSLNATGSYFYMMGFADQGENYTPITVTSMSSYLAAFGSPTNTAETYLYSAVQNVLNNGGVPVVGKLPYTNEVSASYSAIGFSIDATAIEAQPSGAVGTSGADWELYTFNKDYLGIDVDAASGNGIDAVQISVLDDTGDIVPLEITATDLDSVRGTSDFSAIDDATLNSADFIIVNKYRDTAKGENGDNGIFVAVVPAFNAILCNPTWNNGEENPLSGAWPIIGGFNYFSGSDYGTLVGTEVDALAASGLFSNPITNTTVQRGSLSRTAAKQFPQILTTNGTNIDQRYLGYLTVLVCRVNTNTIGKYQIDILESFSGSLNRLAVSRGPNGLQEQSAFLGSIINAQSQYIEFYLDKTADTKIIKSNSNKIYTLKKESTTGANKLADKNITWPLLSFTAAQSAKNITYTGITQGMTACLAQVDDIDAFQIDALVDAGLSDIASRSQAITGEYDPQVYDGNYDEITDGGDLDYWRTTVDTLVRFCSQTRKDCMAIIDGPRHLCLKGNLPRIRTSDPSTLGVFDTDITPKLRYLTGAVATNSQSYGATYITWLKIISPFSGDPMWIPESCAVAGVYARTDSQFNFWEAPAGLNRGGLDSVVDITFNPNGDQADVIYLLNLNYAKKYPYAGFTVEGHKTMQSAPSAFDRVNVRRLMLRIERYAYQAAKYAVYEPNNYFTRTQLIDRIQPQLERIKSLGGVIDYKIVCDETNNTATVIDNNELKLALLIKPTKAADFVLVDTYATRTGTNFEEVLLQ